MKKLLFLLLFIPFISFGQISIDMEYGTFDYYNGVRYRIIQEKDLNIVSQSINLNVEVAHIGYPIRTADLKVEKKDGRTRLTFTNFSIGNINSKSTRTNGNMEYEVNYADYYQINNVTMDSNLQNFKKSFINKYAQRLENAILNAVSNIISNNELEDDW